MLAVGDAAFQQKCFEQFEQLKREGKTIVLVTHDMSAVERFCDRAMLIDRGDVLELGEPHEIALAYNELNFGRLVTTSADGAGRYGDHAAAEINDAWFEDDAGERITELAQGEPCTMCMEVHVPRARSRTRSSRSTCATSRATPCSRRRRTGERSRRGSFAAGETAHGPRALRELARADALHGQPVGRARAARATTRSTCARTSRRWWCTARA